MHTKINDHNRVLSPSMVISKLNDRYLFCNLIHSHITHTHTDTDSTQMSSIISDIFYNPKNQALLGNYLQSNANNNNNGSISADDGYAGKLLSASQDYSNQHQHEYQLVHQPQPQLQLEHHGRHQLNQQQQYRLTFHIIIHPSHSTGSANKLVVVRLGVHSISQQVTTTGQHHRTNQNQHENGQYFSEVYIDVETQDIVRERAVSIQLYEGQRQSKKSRSKGKNKININNNYNNDNNRNNNRIGCCYIPVQNIRQMIANQHNTRSFTLQMKPNECRVECKIKIKIQHKVINSNQNIHIYHIKNSVGSNFKNSNSNNNSKNYNDNGGEALKQLDYVIAHRQKQPGMRQFNANNNRNNSKSRKISNNRYSSTYNNKYGYKHEKQQKYQYKYRDSSSSLVSAISGTSSHNVPSNILLNYQLGNKPITFTITQLQFTSMPSSSSQFSMDNIVFRIANLSALRDKQQQPHRQDNQYLCNQGKCRHWYTLNQSITVYSSQLNREGLIIIVQQQQQYPNNNKCDNNNNKMSSRVIGVFRIGIMVLLTRWVNGIFPVHLPHSSNNSSIVDGQCIAIVKVSSTNNININSNHNAIGQHAERRELKYGSWDYNVGHLRKNQGVTQPEREEKLSEIIKQTSAHKQCKPIVNQTQSHLDTPLIHTHPYTDTDRHTGNHTNGYILTIDSLLFTESTAQTNNNKNNINRAWIGDDGQVKFVLRLDDGTVRSISPDGNKVKSIGLGMGWAGQNGLNIKKEQECGEDGLNLRLYQIQVEQPIVIYTHNQLPPSSKIELQVYINSQLIGYTKINTPQFSLHQYNNENNKGNHNIIGQSNSKSKNNVGCKYDYVVQNLTTQHWVCNMMANIASVRVQDGYFPKGYLQPSLGLLGCRQIYSYFASLENNATRLQQFESDIMNLLTSASVKPITIAQATRIYDLIQTSILENAHPQSIITVNCYYKTKQKSLSHSMRTFPLSSSPFRYMQQIRFIDHEQKGYVQLQQLNKISIHYGMDDRTVRKCLEKKSSSNDNDGDVRSYSHVLYLFLIAGVILNTKVIVVADLVDKNKFEEDKGRDMEGATLLKQEQKQQIEQNYKKQNNKPLTQIKKQGYNDNQQQTLKNQKIKIKQNQPISQIQHFCPKPNKYSRINYVKITNAHTIPSLSPSPVLHESISKQSSITIPSIRLSFPNHPIINPSVSSLSNQNLYSTSILTKPVYRCSNPVINLGVKKLFQGDVIKILNWDVSKQTNVTLGEVIWQYGKENQKYFIGGSAYAQFIEIQQIQINKARQ